jgi:acetyl-CoA C-acetyltransferase
MIDQRTPVLIAAGQVVERDATSSSPMQLAANAAQRAISNAGGNNIAGNIDTIAVTRLFSDMGPLWPCKLGRSNNPPESIARIIGASPKHRIYSQAGGNEPQSLLIEFAHDIAAGKRDMVLLAGAEAMRNQRYAERNETPLDWNEDFTAALDDRGFGDSVATTQEIKNGLNNVLYYYALIEQAQRTKAGRTIAQHQSAMALLLSSFSTVADGNPYAQFVGKQTAEDILSAAPVNNLYTKRMIAQDSVNQGAALIMCSLAKARALSIPAENIIYLHGLAQGSDVPVSQRPDPAISIVANQVVDLALSTAKLTIEDIDLIDIYSCFPCAVTAITDHLGLPSDGSKTLSLTGGLPYFGGPGNNYSMHALAETVMQLRLQPDHYAMVTSNGGVLSKHATGIYSRRPSSVDWSAINTKIDTASLPKRSISNAPTSGKIVSYTVYPDHNGMLQAIALAKTDSNEHFVAITNKDDVITAKAMVAEVPTGKTINVSPPEDGRLIFQLDNNK